MDKPILLSNQIGPSYFYSYICVCVYIVAHVLRMLLKMNTASWKWKQGKWHLVKGRQASRQEKKGEGGQWKEFVISTPQDLESFSWCVLREMVDPSWKLPSQQLTKSAVWPGKPNYDTHPGPLPFMSDWKKVGDSRWQSRSSRCSQENVCWDLNPCRASTGGWNSQESIAGPG